VSVCDLLAERLEKATDICGLTDQRLHLLNVIAGITIPAMTVEVH
jgi:hypothetical protein